ncbi:hypothetical protein BsWGS_15336 [Bradybaena similaris]
MAATEEASEKPRSRKIFLNHIDCFQGRNIGKYLSQCEVGSTLGMPDREGRSREPSMISTDAKKIKEGYYEIVGTAKDRESLKPDFAKEIVQYENQTQLYEYLVECDIIIYDITDDYPQIQEAVWIITEMYSQLDRIEKPKVFILVSTCMTWARTASHEPEYTEDVFTEDDYRRRKPHPNFKEHINAEKTVLKLGKMNKAKLSTFVICSGLTYGAGENILHYLFKDAWHNAPFLNCIGDGQNILPMIHIHDLAAIIQNVADGWSKSCYIIAKDNSNNTLEDVVKAISDTLGSKHVKHISKEEAFLNPNMEQAVFDTLLVNLKMDSTAIRDEMLINWTSEAGFAENIKQVVEEYKQYRNLQPIRVVILGPPASGKSTISQQLCSYYKLHHVTIQDVIDAELAKLEATAKAPFHKLHAQPVINRATLELLASEAKEFLAELEDSRERNNERLEDKYVIGFLRNRLMSMPCQNQGFVLDGYPKTIAQAQELYKNLTLDDSSADVLDTFNKNILPEFVINLEATDAYLRRTVMNLPESSVINTHNNELDLTRRLKAYWAVNTYDETVLNFFDELELHSEKFDVTMDKSQMLKDTVDKIKKIIGNPRNYGSTIEELEARRREIEEGKMTKELMDRKQVEQYEADELQEKKRRLEEWSQRLMEVKKQEFELLEVESIPLRNYLMTYVMPTLTQGLIDCCKVRPDDPIDFLAEYLFQHNPQID